METIIKVEKDRPGLIDSWQQELRQIRILAQYIFQVLPEVKKLLNKWEKEACHCRDTSLRQQALASLRYKDFHCQGGAVFVVPANGQRPVLSLIVAYQTICDYLDNLCDRAGSTDGEAFLQLHQALIDALTPWKKTEDYYKHYPLKDDGAYLQKLVHECRSSIEHLPSYSVVYEELMKLVDYYIQLQVKKHLALDIREMELKNWVNQQCQDYPEIYWQEFAAASGSTLALFALFGLASRDHLDKDTVSQTMDAYFPWICGLHILLDYFIDQSEDLEGGDLNFTFYYRDTKEMLERLKVFIREAHSCAGHAEPSAFNKTVVEGLLAMYLTDRKVKKEGLHNMAKELIDESGRGAWNTYRICSLVRKAL